MYPLPLIEILRVTGGLLVIGDPKSIVGAEESYNVSIDSRTLRHGDIFIPIKGERVNGHQFINDAIKKGASLCFMNQISPTLSLPPAKFPNLIKVKDTKSSLGSLAKYYIEKFSKKSKRVGISGSCGKTTVKEMTAQILNRMAPTAYSPGNFNNEIGCPLSVFSLTTDHQFAVFEIGASASGEVKRLSEIVQPHIAVVTNIQLEHTATFGNLENIARGESEILDSLPSGGVAVLPFDDPYFDFMKSKVNNISDVSVKTFGLSDKASVTVTDISTWPEPTRFKLIHKDNQGNILDQIDCTLPIPGRFNILNACASAAVCFSLNVPANVIADGLAHFSAPPMRFEVIHLSNGTTLVNDSYNANPGSMRSALQGFVDTFSHKNLCVVLGDMLELGEISHSEHLSLGKFIAGLPLSKMIFYGPQSRFIGEGAKSLMTDEKMFTYCTDKESLYQTVQSCLIPGAALLFKASRGMHLEEIVQKVVENQHALLSDHF